LESEAFTEAKNRLKKSGKSSKKQKAHKLVLVDESKADEKKSAPGDQTDISDQIF